jgi:hypothetical protein
MPSGLHTHKSDSTLVKMKFDQLAQLQRERSGEKWREEEEDVLHGLDYCGEWGAMWEGPSHCEIVLVRTSISMMRCFKIYYSTQYCSAFHGSE